MHTIYNYNGCEAMTPCVATIGFFDGVHRGHRYLIKKMKELAAGENGMASTVITFDRHPRLVLNKEFQPKLLNTNEEKQALLAKTGVDNCVMLHFDKETAALSARDFIHNVLHDKLNVKKLVTGYDNRFGHNRAEGFDDYVAYGREVGIEVICGEAFVLNGVNVSSSVIRSFLSEGEVKMAAMCLGYPYFLTGRVVSGFQEGRKLGFPTANLKVEDAFKLIPKPGVYAVRVMTEDSKEAMGGMMNIGTRPTFDGHETTLEVNIFNFNGDLYGQNVEVMFVSRLREEQRFSSVQKLAAQLATDRRMAEEELGL